MKYRKLLLHLALLLIVTAPAFPAVELYDVHNTLYAPSFIDYTLNCTADVTIEILPCNIGGTPTGPAVKTVTFTNQAKGFHRYIWMADADGGGTAPQGYYVPRLTANANTAQWGPISGLYLNSDWTHEYAANPLPPAPETEAFYGIGVNKDPDSDYYGRVYVTHKLQKDILMYGPAGNYLGKFDDSAVAWGTSAPWDLAVADDGYVYVCDRSTMIIHCFAPDGTYMSTSPTLTNFRAIFARTTGDGRTHIVYSGSTSIREIIVEPDHITWTTPITPTLYTAGTSGDAYGIWVSPDLQTIYQACISGTNAGLTRWLKQPAGTYSRDTGFTCGNSIGACVDVDYVDAPGLRPDYLWVTKMAAYVADNTATTQNESSRAIHKVNLDSCSVTNDPYNIVTWGFMVSADAVGNPAVTFGKNTATWAQKYWGLFAEAGVSTTQKLVPTYRFYFSGAENSCPIIIPDSEVWTPDNVIAPDDTDTASVSVKAISLSGWAYITSATIDLRPLGYGSLPGSIIQDPSDPTGRTAIITFSGIKAKAGTRCTTSYGQPPHYLEITLSAAGCEGGPAEPQYVEIEVTGVGSFDTFISHRRVPGWYIGGAQIVAVGGGIPGTTDPRAAGPFTYTSAPSDSSGYAGLEMSAGSFQVKAHKLGFGSEAPVTVVPPYFPFGDLSLRPMTVAEVRNTAAGTNVNMEGVCYAQPVGYDCFGQIAQYGLAPRTDTLALRNQWYVCDPNDPANGMLCLITKPTDMFLPQWDCPTGDDMFGNLTYIGKYPTQGETIMVTAMLDTPGGHERRVLVQDADLEAGISTVPMTINRTYLNRGNVGGYPPAPIVVPLTDVAHPGTVGISSSWGKYVQVNNVTVIKIDPVGNDIPGGDAVPYAVVADAAGNTCEIAIQTPTTLNMTQWANPGVAPDLGCTYDIRGAAGRRARYGNGCIRVRGYEDFTAISCIGPADELGSVRGLTTGSPVTVHGIVTAKIGSSIWIEAADRSAGIRVMANPSYVAVGDDVEVAGTIALSDGERVIQPSVAIIPLSTGNEVPGALDLRTRDVGGKPCLADPGVTNGQGALNVGLMVHVQGMVTSAGSGYYYIWDGANHSDLPVSDGTGNIGIRIEAAPPTGAVAWQDWVDVTGVVSTDATLAPGAVAPTIIPTAVSKVTAFDTITTPVDKPLRAGWNLMSVPAVPAATGDGEEFTPKPWDDYMVLGPNQSPDDIDGRLYRWDNCTGGLELWDQWSEVGSHGRFGGILPGDGYWLDIPADWPVSYSGRSSSLDQWIGICRDGWALIGHPKDHPTLLNDVTVHTGDRVVSMYDAILTEGWIDCVSYWWDADAQGLVDVGVPDCWGSTDTLLPWHGYWMQFYRGDMSLIVPETPAAP